VVSGTSGRTGWLKDFPEFPGAAGTSAGICAPAYEAGMLFLPAGIPDIMPGSRSGYYIKYESKIY